MVNFDNFGGLTSVLKFHIFLIFNCEELVRIRVMCEGLVGFFSSFKFQVYYNFLRFAIANNMRCMYNISSISVWR